MKARRAVMRVEARDVGREAKMVAMRAAVQVATRGMQKVRGVVREW